MDVLLIALPAVLALVFLTLLKAYGVLSERELKLRAREGDQMATRLHRARAYRESLAVLLWLGAGVSSAWFFWSVAQNTSWWVAVSASALLVWLGFAWLPARRVSSVSLHLAAYASLPLAWTAERLHVLINPVVRVVNRYWPDGVHTGLYDTDDLLDLLYAQAGQPDNRIDRTTLDIAANALTFGHRLVGDVMTSKRHARVVSANDHIGPALMNELHDSGHAYFPVYEGKRNNIVGALSLRDLVDAKPDGLVKDRMHKEVYSLSEDQPLSDTLETILQPNRHLFVVVNDLDKYVGVVTTEDILRQIIGQPAQDEIEQYEELSAPPDETEEPADLQTPTEDVPEVVE